MSPRLLVDISAHGFGHLAQTGPVLDALRARRPDLRLCVRSALPRARLALRIGGDFTHIEEARDFGFAMHNAVDVDLPASAARYRAFHADWEARVAAEADWLRAQGIDAVLSNVAYLPLAGAARAGLPAAALCSLNWADLFAAYFATEPWAAPIHAQMLAAYQSASFLRLTPGMPMPALHRVEHIAPIARRGRRDRTAVARALGLEPTRRWVLLAMGGMAFPLPVADWPRHPGIDWLLPAAWGVAREDVRAFDTVGPEFTDLLASVDALITKPGYGTFAEAATHGLPVLYVERGDWPEEPHLTAWLQANGRTAAIDRERLLAGDVGDALQALWRQAAPPVPDAGGAAQAAVWLDAWLGAWLDGCIACAR